LGDKHPKMVRLLKMATKENLRVSIIKIFFTFTHLVDILLQSKVKAKITTQFKIKKDKSLEVQPLQILLNT